MPLRVLLITPEFYGIEKNIKTSLEESGYEVFWIENKNLPLDYHGTYSKLKLLRKLYFFLFSTQKRYINKQLKVIEDHRFDILFSINAHIICPYLIGYLKKKNPNIYSVLYFWDSFSMYNWTNILSYFNRVLTFDSKDSREYNLEYKPIFYIPNIQQKIITEEYDLFFAGKFNPYRLLIIDKILNQAQNFSLKCFVKLWTAYRFFLHNYLIYSLLKKINFTGKWVKSYLLNYEAFEGILRREFISANSLSYDDLQHHFECSNVIVDLPYQEQTGYSHRLIDALANGKKIITTNSDIKKESFYNSMQVQILDQQNPVIDYEWVKEKSKFPVDNYFLDLELSAWLKSIINVEIA